jgi:hypothetical protein
MKISGTVEQGFESVREIFEGHFRTGKEKEAQCCIFYQGRLVKFHRMHSFSIKFLWFNHVSIDG